MRLTNRIAVPLGWLIGRLLPVRRNRVVFSNFYGKGWGDSPKAIAEEILRRKKEIELIWLADGESAAKSVPAGVRVLPYNSIHRGIALGTAAVWVDNNRKGARFKKKTQRYLQTWHGFALKRIEGDAAGVLGSAYETYARRDSDQIDLLISDSSFMTGVYRSAFWYDGEIAEYGLPRNDGLIHGDPKTAERVRSALGIPQGSRLLLYAPTFRADHSMDACSPDYSRMRAACEKRFGGSFAVVVRLHPNVASQAAALAAAHADVVNATDYPDSQELLAAADVLVTDYSSIMFDFMLTGRPCLQYAVDIAEYRKDRNFYLPLDTLPFPLAEDNDAMERAVLAFDEADYRSTVQAFVQRHGMITDGCAAERCTDRILGWLQEVQV